MSHGVPLLYWRNGRPRWEPGPSLRKRGWKGCNLVNQAGEFLSFYKAAEIAQLLNDQASSGPKKFTTIKAPASDQPTPFDLNQHQQGWIYIIRFPDRIKIGYSTRPEGRLVEIDQQQAHSPSAVLIMRGSMLEEKLIHQRLSSLKLKGEWYDLSMIITRFVNASFQKGTIAWEQLPKERPQNKPADLECPVRPSDPAL